MSRILRDVEDTGDTCLFQRFSVRLWIAAKTAATAAPKDRKDKMPVWSRVLTGSLVNPVGPSDKTLYVNQEQKLC